MDLPEFGPPKLDQPQNPPSSAPPSLQPPVVAAPVASNAARRAWMWRRAIILTSVGTVVSGGAMIAGIRHRTPQEKVTWAARDAVDPVNQRDTERLTRKLAEVRALVERLRPQRGRGRDVQALSAALDACAVLIQTRNFAQADQRLEAIKKSIPPLAVSNPLAAAPKPIDVPAPPAQKAVSPGDDGAAPVPASGKRSKKKAKKKTKKKVRKTAE